MNLNRFLACLVGLAALVLSLFAYEEYIRLLGFPDGHITELGLAEEKLAMVFIGLSLPISAYLFYLGGVAGRRKVGRELIVAIVLYVLVLAGTVAVDFYHQSHLDNGIGG